MPICWFGEVKWMSRLQNVITEPAVTPALRLHRLSPRFSTRSSRIPLASVLAEWNIFGAIVVRRSIRRAMARKCIFRETRYEKTRRPRRIVGVDARHVGRGIVCRLHAEHPPHQRLAQPYRIEQQIRIDLFGRGRRQGRVHRRRSAARDGDQPGTRQAQGPERDPAQWRRQFPGFAVLHDIQGQGGGRVSEPDEVRRDDRRQPRVR